MGQQRNQGKMEENPWRAVKPAALEQGEASSPAQHIAIAQVVDDVAKLSMGSDKAILHNEQAPATDIIVTASDSPAAVATDAEPAALIFDNGNAAPGAAKSPLSGSSSTEKGNGQANVATISTNLKTTRAWKRRERAINEELEVQRDQGQMVGTGPYAGVAHKHQGEDDMGEPAIKRPLLAVPSLSECLGAEGLHRIRN
jgi:hypothetical protein